MAWCRARTSGERPAFVVPGRFVGFSGIWSHFWMFYLFPPLQSGAHHKMLFYYPTGNPFPILGHIFLALYSHIQQIKTYHFCFPFSQRISESYSDTFICLNGPIDLIHLFSPCLISQVPYRTAFANRHITQVTF